MRRFDRINRRNQEMIRPIRVLVVDDSAFFRKVLTAEITKDPRFAVVGVAADGRSAIECTKQLVPDVVTLDIEMPVMGGLDALRAIVALGTSSVIMVSSQTEKGAQVTMEALEAGAVDFIPKAKGAFFIHEKIQAAADVALLTRARLRRNGPPPLATRQASTVPTVSRLASPRRDIEIVVVGSSTGGPQALLTMMRSIAQPLPVPVVVAQHMPAHFTEALAKRLDEHSRLTVLHAHDGQKLASGNVYIAPGGSTLRVRKGEIALGDVDEPHLYKPSVDVLVASASAVYGKKVMGVLLTGMGADGAKEMTRLRKLGGYTIAQDQATSVVYGMPRSLVEMGGADEVVPLSEIGARVAAVLGSATGLPAKQLELG
jgi:two-component system, chemotaxis family, protein-glutamate methylesterase/glutaminase